MGAMPPPYIEFAKTIAATVGADIIRPFFKNCRATVVNGPDRSAKSGWI